jgi:hypothetical protein
MSINRILADLGKAVDSSSTGNFLNKEASGAEFNPVQWSDINSAPTILDSALASAIIDSAYVQARQTGVGSGGIDSATTIALIDSDYVGARATTGGSGFTKYQYTATASQTTFQDSDANGNVLSYDADYILVHYNGVLLPSADYTATDGSSVVLGTGADSGSIIAIAKWGAAAGSSSGGSAGIAFGGDRGLMAGGRNTSVGWYNIIDYFDLTSPGNASDFGDLTNARTYVAGASSTSTAVFAGGFVSGFVDVNTIDYVTIASTSNATDFGDLSVAKYDISGVSDGTYGVFAGGFLGNPTYSTTNVIDYVTIASPSNASDFGDLTYAVQYLRGVTDGTYGVYHNGGALITLEYITIATTGNGSDFGDLADKYSVSSSSNDTIGLFPTHAGSGSNLYYITIATPGNATDWGYNNLSSSSNKSRGVISNNTVGVYGGGDDYTTSIEYITFDTPSDAADFGDLTTGRAWHAGAAGSPS